MSLIYLKLSFESFFLIEKSSIWNLDWRRMFLWVKALDWESDSHFKPWICYSLILWFWLWSSNALKLVFNLKPWSSPMKIKHRLKSLLNGRFSLPKLISLAVKWVWCVRSATEYFYKKHSDVKISSGLCNMDDSDTDQLMSAAACKSYYAAKQW